MIVGVAARRDWGGDKLPREFPPSFLPAPLTVMGGVGGFIN